MDRGRDSEGLQACQVGKAEKTGQPAIEGKEIKVLRRLLGTKAAQNGVDASTVGRRSYDLLEIFCMVVDGDLRPKVTNVVRVARRTGGQHLEACVRCELDRETADTAGTGMNQDGLASANVQPTVQGVIRAEAGTRQGSSVDERYAVGNAANRVRRGHRELGKPARLREIT